MEEEKAVNLVFPHQLFEDIELLTNGSEVYLIEEDLFFGQYKFHKQKIAFHRASMKAYQKYLENKNINVHYIESIDSRSAVSYTHLTLPTKRIV